MRTISWLPCALVQRTGRTPGIEEFDLEDTQHQHQPDRSVHPAYHFRISARDAARFGLLYLSNGVWNWRQIVPQAWVGRSTRPISTLGACSQVIIVIPEAHVVFVHRVDSFNGQNVPLREWMHLLDKVIAAAPASGT